MTILDGERVGKVEALCEQIVPGSSAVGPAVYIDAVLAGMPPEVRAFALHAIDTLSAAASLEEQQRCNRLRELIDQGTGGIVTLEDVDTLLHDLVDAFWRSRVLYKRP